MDWMVTTGSVSLGVIVGALVGWYVIEADKWDWKALAASVSILTGGGVLALFGFLSKEMPREIWLYPLGLLLGFVTAMGLDYVHYDYHGNERPPKQPKRSD